MKRFYTLTLLLLTLVATAAQAQINFSVSYKRVSPTEYDIIFSGTAEPGWHVYSTDIPSGGPTPATFNTDAAKGVETVGKLKKEAEKRCSMTPCSKWMWLILKTLSLLRNASA